MRELRAIVEAMGALRAGEAAVLATLVKVEGSTYRRPGARMLVLGDGRRVGSISGGCMENDVCRQGQSLEPGAGPKIVKYSTLDDAEAFWGFGMGCKGVLSLLLERVEGGRQTPEIEFIQGCLAEGQAGAMATVCSASGPGAPAVGARMMMRGEQVEMAGLWPADLAQAMAVELHQTLERGRSNNRVVESAGGRLEVFCEIIRPAVHLVIFGAGDNARPVVRLAKELGWDVTVWDRRAEWADAKRFPQADAVVACPPGEVAQRLLWRGRMAAVVMTHNYPDDLDLLRVLLPAPLAYVGILGARARTQRLVKDLLDEGLTLDPSSVNRLHGPVGLDIGAEGPEEIALAIVAEVQAVLNDRAGGLLRQRKGAMHE